MLKIRYGFRRGSLVGFSQRKPKLCFCKGIMSDDAETNAKELARVKRAESRMREKKIAATKPSKNLRRCKD